MPLTISSAMIQEKNKLAGSGGHEILLLDIDIPNVSENVRITSDNVETVWNGNTYVPAPFEIDEITDMSSGEVPQVEFRVANASRAMEAYIQAWDYYCKTNGYSPIEITLSVVHSAHLDLTTAEVEYTLQLKQPKHTPQWATFVLGANNPMNKRFPLNRMLKNRCRYAAFKDTRCGYTGGETVCNRTLSRCRELSNSSRFGGFPGIGKSPIYLT